MYIKYYIILPLMSSWNRSIIKMAVSVGGGHFQVLLKRIIYFFYPVFYPVVADAYNRLNGSET